jgi:phage terminase large subunit
MISTQTTENLLPTLNPNLKDFWLEKADLKILKGGRMSSKTWDAAGVATYLADNYKTKFLCLRQFQNKISQSVYANLKIQIERFKLGHRFDAQNTVLYNRFTKSEFHFYGMQRNLFDIKGFEGADICWIEEGEGLTKEQWEIIYPTLRKAGCECWILYNPHLETDFIETSPLFKPSSDNRVIVRHINYDENPFLSKVALRKIKQLKESDQEEYEHIYLGLPRSSDVKAVIKRAWVQAAIDAHIKLDIPIEGSKDIGFDVADDGKDLCATTYKHGVVALWGEEWKGKEDELLKSCKRVYGLALQVGAHVNYDSIGVGAHCGSKFKEMNTERAEAYKKDKATGRPKVIKYSKFVAGGKTIGPDKYYINDGIVKIMNKDFFSNLKAQAWWLVADRFRNTYNAITNGEVFKPEDLISISKDHPLLDKLIIELSTPLRDFAKDGRVKVESKEDLADREIDSPNNADSFIMAYAPKDMRRGFFDV